MKHSWAFWFNRRDTNIKEVIEGKIYHSYVPDDRMLNSRLTVPAEKTLKEGISSTRTRGSSFLRMPHPGSILWYN